MANQLPHTSSLLSSFQTSEMHLGPEAARQKATVAFAGNSREMLEEQMHRTMFCTTAVTRPCLQMSYAINMFQACMQKGGSNYTREVCHGHLRSIQALKCWSLATHITAFRAIHLVSLEN